ncbi:Fur family transcriptional regulator [Candidatus Symbiothrix dinenymphae]|uniref:Fur family transcriptional regulator n=1 Tax=Candidatus Symbiothrix dinenymphae TaxID=467085 RepID=UPI0006C322EC|nr:Fur family transcriptional regulator [Candidatus Symbiothrix dinenymphae]GAP72570.1 peroxide stress regulator [Candidatus Symbiothrix dinenymphae]
MRTTSNVVNRLEEAGVKPSVQRMAIMKYLVDHPVHPTVDMIFHALFPAMPTLSKTTVYNTLKLLSEEGVVHSIDIDEKNVRYDGDISPHAHFKCKGCGAIIDLHIEMPDNKHIANFSDLKIDECQLYYKGYCKNCITM